MRLTLFKIYVLFVESLHNRVQLSYQCGFCHEIFNNVENYNVHKESHEPNGSFKIVESHFNKSCLRYRRVFGENVVSIHAAFQLVLEELLEIIEIQLAKIGNFKAAVILMVEMVRNKVDGEEERINYALRSPTHEYYESINIRRRMQQYFISKQSKNITLKNE